MWTSNSTTLQVHTDLSCIVEASASPGLAIGLPDRTEPVHTDLCCIVEASASPRTEPVHTDLCCIVGKPPQTEAVHTDLYVITGTNPFTGTLTVPIPVEIIGTPMLFQVSRYFLVIVNTDGCVWIQRANDIQPQLCSGVLADAIKVGKTVHLLRDGKLTIIGIGRLTYQTTNKWPDRANYTVVVQGGCYSLHSVQTGERYLVSPYWDQLIMVGDWLVFTINERLFCKSGANAARLVATDVREVTECSDDHFFYRTDQASYRVDLGNGVTVAEAADLPVVETVEKDRFDKILAAIAGEEVDTTELVEEIGALFNTFAFHDSIIRLRRRVDLRQLGRIIGTVHSLTLPVTVLQAIGPVHLETILRDRDDYLYSMYCTNSPDTFGCQTRLDILALLTHSNDTDYLTETALIVEGIKNGSA